MSTCNRVDDLRDYALDELKGEARAAMERHITTCGDCAAELDRLHLTTAALRVLPDQQVPQRIAFVSDKVFEPSPVSRWFARTHWGFASACVLAVAMIISVWHRPPERKQVLPDVSKQVDAAVAKAAAQVRAEVRSEDARMLQAAIAQSERRHEQEHRALMIAMEENLTVLQKRLNTVTDLAYNDAARAGNNQ